MTSSGLHLKLQPLFPTAACAPDLGNLVHIRYLKALAITVITKRAGVRKLIILSFCQYKNNKSSKNWWFSLQYVGTSDSPLPHYVTSVASVSDFVLRPALLFLFPAFSEELVTTGRHQRGPSPRGADRGEAEGSGGPDWPERAEAAGPQPGGPLAGRHQMGDSKDLFEKMCRRGSQPFFFCLSFFFIIASLGSHCWPLEGQLQEEHAERAAGRADEREAPRSRGPGGAARDEAEDAGDGDAGTNPRLIIW